MRSNKADNKNADKIDFKISFNFDSSNSISSAPSRTIKINPTVPSAGKIGSRFGIFKFKSREICLTIQPNKSKIITEGIFVLEDAMSET